MSALAGRVAGAALTRAADQVDRGLEVALRAYDRSADRGWWRGVAADQLCRALAVDTRSLTATVAALREAAVVLEDFARRCTTDGIDTWALAANRQASGDAASAQATTDAAAVEARAARVAAGRLMDVAARAPVVSVAMSQGRVRLDPPSNRGSMDTGTITAEVKLGAFETVAGTSRAGLSAMHYVRSLITHPRSHGQDLGDVAAAVKDLAEHPRRTAYELLDGETWKNDPSRAAGRLIPDLALAFTGAGSVAAGVRAMGTRVSERVLVMREVRLQAALQARQELVEKAAKHGVPFRIGGERAWYGGPGLSLTREQAEVTRRYWRSSRAEARRIRRQMDEVVKAVGGHLAGIEHSVKDLESLKRKVATAIDESPAYRLPDLLTVLDDQTDTVRFTVVLAEKSYVSSAHKLAAQFDRRSVAPSRWANKWDSGRYRGINTSWTDVRSGVRFEVQLHTPESYAATQRTHLAFERLRLPETQADPSLRAQLEKNIAREFSAAHFPEGVLGLELGKMVPPTLHGWAATPPPLAGGLVAGGVAVATRPSSVPAQTAPELWLR